MSFLTFQFSRPDLAKSSFVDKIISTGIMKETRSEISHVDLLTADGTLIGAHIDSGIRERPGNYTEFGLRIRVTIPVTQEQADRALAYARRMIGTPYDTLSICGIAFGDARLHDATKLICSTFHVLTVRAANIVVVAKDAWQVCPEELRLILTAIPGAVEKRIEGNILA
jgi:hypothetical protein